MDLHQIKSDVGQTWKWVAEGWRHISDRAVNALTYFSPTKNEPDSDGAIRWGLLAADVSEHGDRVRVELEAPGLDKEDIDITVEDDRILISGQKKYESERRSGSMMVKERAFGRFQRAIALPVRVTSDGADAKYRRGVLSIELPKVKEPGRHSIEIRQG
jgi:HSP20 family protein